MSFCIRVINALWYILFSDFSLSIGNVFCIDTIALRLKYDHLQVLSISEKNKANKYRRNKHWGLECKERNWLTQRPIS